MPIRPIAGIAEIQPSITYVKTEKDSDTFFDTHIYAMNAQPKSAMNIETGTAKDVSYKTKMIDLYNEIYKTKYRNTTNCSSCLNSVWTSLMHLNKKYENNK